MERNILKVLGVEAKEDIISNLLAHCFNSSENFRSVFLESVCERAPGSYRSLVARTRVAIPDSGVPDLVIVGQREKGTDLIVIENKLKAEEGQDQTGRYASPECVDNIRRRFNLQPPVKTSFVFLTLFPDQQPQHKKFKPVAYSQVRNALDLLKLGEHSTTERLLRDLKLLLTEFYDYGAPAAGDKLDEKLRDAHTLERAYLYFKAFVSQIPLPKSLRVEGTARWSRLGRRVFGARISKDRWHPSEWRREENGRVLFNPKTDFNIHFEPQYNVLSGALNIYLHYEINPYEPESWAATNIRPKKYRDYQEIRTRFVQGLEAESAVLPELVIGGRSNQVAKANADFQGKTVDQCLWWIGGLLESVAPVIDRLVRDAPTR